MKLFRQCELHTPIDGGYICRIAWVPLGDAKVGGSALGMDVAIVYDAVLRACDCCGRLGERGATCYCAREK